MAITRYEQDGKTLWKVYLNLRSKVNPTIRVQKRILELESEKAAQTEEKKLLRELSEKLAKLEGQGLTWNDVIERWEIAVRSGASPHDYQATTIIDYVNALKKWTVSWLSKPANELTKADGREALLLVEKEGKTRMMQKKLKHTINVVYEWGIENKFIRGVSESPVQGLKLTKPNVEKSPEILNLQEIRKLLCEAKRLEHSWFPVWAMALLTGMRNGELYALCWTDVDLENRHLIVSKSYNTRMKAVKSTKAGYWRRVPISDELHALLLQLKAQDPKREHVLPRFWQWEKGMQAEVLRKFCLGIGIKSIRFHTLRACFSTQLLSHDIAPARVMKICGWRDLKTMQHYVRLAGIDEQGATEALRILPSDEALMGEVVSIFDFKAKRDDKH